MSATTSLIDSSKQVPAASADTCPVCGTVGATKWLDAPDRFHGRDERHTLLRCAQCSLVWLAGAPSPNEMHHHYTEAYHNLISQSGDDPARWCFRKEAIFRFKQSGALLDLGCSSGDFLAFMGGESWNLYGVEMSASDAAKARSRSGGQVFSGLVADAPFQDEAFDVITCFDVLEHLYEPRLIMQKVARWLKPGGIFYVLVPNIDSAEAKVFGSYWHGLELPRHLFHYSPASLEFLARSAGLSKASVETHRNQAVGTSLRYVGDTALRSVGIRRTPVAYRGRTSLPGRAARKLARVTVLQCLLALAPLVGGGESIHAVFRKDENARS